MKRWKGSGTCEGERKLDEVFILAWVGTKTRQYKVKALVLIAAQYKMPEKLLKFQNMLFRFMPNTMFKQFGLKKADVIRLCGTMTELDFRDSLCKVSCPALIVCGEKDNANKKASKELASYLSDSHFHELLKAGHEANIESPEELATVLQKFYDNVE